ncbi:MAG: isoleucine--tRNA ligase [Chlamydiales bacterium]
MFKEIANETFASREERILEFWKKGAIFEKSLEKSKKGPFFSFYDGPPFATGLPHYGHILAGTIKDVIPRYKTMKGYYVPRRFGWDCHGLPVENEIEKMFCLSGAPSIEKFGINRFNEECRKIVLRYTADWESKVERFGRWVDFSKTWKTMDPPFMESVWWVFKEAYQKGLIYEGFKVMPFSAKLGTPISNFEATDNYKEVDDPSIVVTLPLIDDPKTALLVWTTTPWTLISNMAATVSEDSEYVKVVHEEKFYIVAKKAVDRWFKNIKIIASFKGKELVNQRYQPLFPYFSHLKTAFHVIADDFVSMEEGTGIVHTAPAFGEVDFYACKKANIPFVCPVDNNGCFTDEIPPYQGLFVKAADHKIIHALKASGRLFYRGTIRHRYPFCWRSDTPLIYKAITTWFLNVEKIKNQLLTANKSTHWVPNHLQEGRFQHWLEGARDWAISRNRYWGTPIPIWRSEDGEIHVIGSISELEKLTGEKVHDLHRHYIDGLTFEKNGKIFKRIFEVFDCWFESGSMPYAQNHYPFDNKRETETAFPADFIAEGVDQTRAWFYTLLVIGVALFDTSPYKNVIANGILLAEDGNKMSKRLKNYPEPDLVIHKYGADAVRLYLLNSPAVKADDLRFSERGVEVVLRQVLIPLWHAHAFFITYAKIYAWSPNISGFKPEMIIDQWIIAQLNKLIFDVQYGMDLYDLSLAVEPFVHFIHLLTNWYIRRSRRRFWSDEKKSDQNQAFHTLYCVLVELCKIAAPFIPFLSEAIYRNIRTDSMPDSVHLCDYPNYDCEARKPELEAGMDILQTVVSLGHSLRKEHKLKVRQPLLSAHVVCNQEKLLQFLQREEYLITEELNVKKVYFYRENQDFIRLSVKPNFRVLGKKIGKHMKAAQLLIQKLEQEKIHALLNGEAINFTFGDESFLITAEDVEIVQEVRQGWVAMNSGNVTIVLDIGLTQELILEGIARELINKINTMRREANFAVTDRICVRMKSSEKIQQALVIHKNHICSEVLAIEMTCDSCLDGTHWDINGESTEISIKRASSS